MQGENTFQCFILNTFSSLLDRWLTQTLLSSEQQRPLHLLYFPLLLRSSAYTHYFSDPTQ